MTATDTSALPIRSIGDLEVPTAGTWPIVRASSVDRSTHRPKGLRPLRVLAGRFEIAEDPADSSLRIDVEDSTLIATTVSISADPNGMSRWRLAGVVERVGGHDPLTLSLSYHGVYRRGDELWAWMSGTGSIGGLRGTSESHLLLDLMFTVA
ncbi:MAG: hypothetical protein ACRDZZ_15685 [Ilumatobacteraceae bacterium]